MKNLSFIVSVALAALGATWNSAAAESAFPLRISADQRYLVDAQGNPFLVHGESSWEIVYMLTKEEIADYFDIRAAQGFNATFMNILPDSDDPHTRNRYGAEPFRDPLDFRTMNEAYFDHAEWVVAEALRHNMAAFIFPCYLGISISWSDELGANGVEKTTAYGRLLAERFGKYPNVVWVMGGDIDPGEVMAEQVALAQAVHHYDPLHLMSFHGREHSSGDLFHQKEWLGINFTYSYIETYTQTHQDRRREPVKPTLLCESGYEREANDWRYGTPQRMRRQAYWTLLAGSCGHFYGTAFWHAKPGWRESLDWPGAHQMKIVREFFESLPWYTLVPEFEKKLIVAGNGEYGSNDDYMVAAATPDLNLAVLYMPIARYLGLDLTIFPAPLQAQWFDPTTGIYGEPFQLQNRRYGDWGDRIAPPARDCDSDWVLLLRCSD